MLRNRHTIAYLWTVVVNASLHRILAGLAGGFGFYNFPRFGFLYMYNKLFRSSYIYRTYVGFGPFGLFYPG